MIDEIQQIKNQLDQWDTNMRNKNKARIQAFLLKFPLFMSVYQKKGVNNFSKIAINIQLTQHSFGQNLYESGQNQNFKFIISGSVLLFVQKADDPTSIPLFFQKIGPNQHFGEKQIYNGNQKLHSAKSISHIYLLQLNLQIFYKTFEGLFRYEELKQKIQFLGSIWIFKQIRECQIQRILMLSKPYRYVKNTILFRQGQKPEAVYIVVEGQLTLEQKQSNNCKKPIMLLGKGQICAWQQVLQKNTMPYQGYVSSSTAVLLKIKKTLFYDVFSSKITKSVIKTSNDIKQNLIQRKSRRSITLSLQKIHSGRKSENSQSKQYKHAMKSSRYYNTYKKAKSQMFEPTSFSDISKMEISWEVQLKHKQMRQMALSQLKNKQKKKIKRISMVTNQSLTNDKQLLLEYLVKKQRKQMIADQKEQKFRQTQFHMVPLLKIQNSAAVRNHKRKLKQSRRKTTASMPGLLNM